MLGEQVSFDDQNESLNFQDSEIQNSIVNQALTIQNEELSQKEMHSLILQLEKQNLDLVALLDQVSDTSTSIKTSSRYAVQKIKQEMISNRKGDGGHYGFD